MVGTIEQKTRPVLCDRGFLVCCGKISQNIRTHVYLFKKKFKNLKLGLRISVITVLSEL